MVLQGEPGVHSRCWQGTVDRSAGLVAEEQWG